MQTCPTCGWIYGEGKCPALTCEPKVMSADYYARVIEKIEADLREARIDYCVALHAG